MNGPEEAILTYVSIAPRAILGLLDSMTLDSLEWFGEWALGLGKV